MIRRRVLGGLRAGERVARVLPPVGEHDDAVGLARRQHRQGELDRLEDVRAVPIDLRLRTLDGRARGERLIDDRLLAEGDHAVAVAALHRLGGFGDEPVRALARGEAHAVRQIDQEHDVHAVDPPRQGRSQQA